MSAPGRNGQGRLKPMPVVSRQFALKTGKARSIGIGGKRQPARITQFHNITPSSMYGQRNNRYAVGPVVRRAVEFLPEDIRIDLFVGVFAIPRFQSRSNRCEKHISAVDDRRAGVEKQAAARIQAIDAVFDDTDRQIKAQLAAAVSIEPRRAVYEIRRIGDDEVAAL